MQERQALCEAIAGRVAADEAYGEIVQIRLMTGTHDAVAYLADGTVGQESEQARCRVVRVRGAVR